MSLFTENYSIVGMIEPADNQGGGIDSESIDMSKLHRVSLIYQAGAITGDDSVIKLYAGATTGVKTTEVPFHYRLSGADFKATGNDQFGNRTAVAIGGTGLTMSAAAYGNRIVVIDVDATDMPDGLEWLTVDYDDGSASVLLSSMIAIGEPRYLANDVLTVVA